MECHSPTRPTSLLCLPFELRTKIWSYALGGTVFEVQCWPSHGLGRIATRIANRAKHRCSLLRTCHQIYSETKLTLFRHNGFVFKNEDAVFPWLQRLRESEREAVTEIHLVTWEAAHMIQGHSSCLQPVSAVMPLERLPGLTRVQIEIRRKANCRSCWHNCCKCCKVDVELVKAQLATAITVRQPRVRVAFVEHEFGSVVTAKTL